MGLEIICGKKSAPFLAFVFSQRSGLTRVGVPECRRPTRSLTLRWLRPMKSYSCTFMRLHGRANKKSASAKRADPKSYISSKMRQKSSKTRSKRAFLSKTVSRPAVFAPKCAEKAAKRLPYVSCAPTHSGGPAVRRSGGGVRHQNPTCTRGVRTDGYSKKTWRWGRYAYMKTKTRSLTEHVRAPECRSAGGPHAL